MLDVAAPLGRFRTPVDPARTRSYVAFAAGSGITPVLSLATDILAREPTSRFTLDLWQSQHRADDVSRGDARAEKSISRQILGAFRHEPGTARDGAVQRPHRCSKVRDARARQFTDIASADEYFICGPGRMVEEVRDAIKALERRRRRCGSSASRPAIRRAPGRPQLGAARPRAAPRFRAQPEILSTISIHHGRQAPQFSDEIQRCIGTRGRRTRRPRIAVFLPFGHLCHLPCENRRGRSRDGSQHCACSRGRSRPASCCVARRGRPPHARTEL